ncbi:adenylylsulfate kinase-like enzyme [Murinocardiopsis flavida]|uniref:Adenylylsulfate kinase-like enzyme n=1 Tax=Murinocardiopsis flavida TaxID=645275 RepID=A0A2P8DDT1_9ACTN|nr:AAA family ATPase [Murinocardiopsis flavida]PSK95362.1 adenylylsulfate kinase-like enzyme [Murinocardiopsis flavida]
MAGPESSGCLILSGVPGAGKSTVAPLVAARYPRAAHISGDVLSYTVVQGRVGFNGEPAEESLRQLRLCARNMCTLANNFADSGIVPVVEYTIVDRWLLDLMLGMLRPAPVMFVALAPPLSVCRRRNAARPAEQGVDFDFAPSYRLMREQLGGVGWWLDTEALTPEETADTIAAHARDRAVV